MRRGLLRSIPLQTPRPDRDRLQVELIDEWGHFPVFHHDWIHVFGFLRGGGGDFKRHKRRKQAHDTQSRRREACNRPRAL
jgi:hypothetical protein